MDDVDKLVERLKGGDTEALVAFIDARRPQLLAFIERSTSDQLRKIVEAVDILQEVSINAIDGLDAIELGDRDPFNWLCQLAERRIIDAHRKYIGAQKRSANKEVGLQTPRAGSDQQGLIDILVASITSPSGVFSRGQREFELLKAMDDLPEEAREALRMRYVENLPSKEIAEKLGKSDGAIRVLLSRSLDRLERKLSENSLFQSFQQKR